MTEIVSQHVPNQEQIIHNPIWYKALTLKERLSSLREQEGQNHPQAIYNTQLAERKLQQWREQSPFGQGTYFADRLAMDSLTENDLLNLLGESDEVVETRMRDVPIWLQEIASAFNDVSQLDEINAFTQQIQLMLDDKTNTLSMSKQFSFLVAIAPLIVGGIKRIKDGLTQIVSEFAFQPFNPDTVHQVLFTNLPEQLSRQILRTIVLELNVARLEERLQGETPEERFFSFVLQMSTKESMLSLLEEYPPLARILVKTIENWGNYSLEFLRHLCADWNDICQTIFLKDDPGQLIEVNGGVGDLHKNGRSTLKLKFSSGVQLIYKPKSMTIDMHFQELLAWLNERGNHCAFQLTKVIDRGSYGWSEFIVASGCSTKDDIARFYERQGGYLALLYALEATDAHYENLIAAGEHPMMIDLESLFHPRTDTYTQQLPQKTAMEAMNSSVLRIGLLPARIWGNAEREGIDMSGLGGRGGQLLAMAMPTIADAGTDKMHFVRKYTKVLEKQNRPTLDGKNVNVLDYTQHIVAGFTKIYNLLMTYREDFFRGPLLRFVHDEIRVIIRSTQVYVQLLYESYHPDLLRNTLDRDRFFDRLWTGVEYQRHLKRLIPAELIDLHAGDIPIFTGRIADQAIYTSQGECIPDFFEETSFDSVRKRLNLFNEQDLNNQIWFIQASLATILVDNGHISYRGSELKPSVAQATHERLIQAACTIGDRLCERALVSEHNANWIVFTYVNEREWRLLPANSDLYSGTSGITLFLAFLGIITGNEKYTTYAKLALATMKEHVKELKKYVAGIGGFNGWGAILYLYAHLGTIWHEPGLFSEAEEIIPYFINELKTDQFYDVISGSAGGISCLLSLYSVAPSPAILSAAIQCGDWLITHAHQCIDNPFGKTAKSETLMPSRHPLTGFSHGAAGMALSLLRLAEVSKGERFREAAFVAMEYERSTFSPEKQNWPDFRNTDSAKGEDTYMVTWCHGAPGIGLGRLNSLCYIDDPTIREEINIAIRTTIRQGFGLNHSLCHGDLGNLETLLSAALILDNPYYQEQLEVFTAMILDSIETLGWRTGIPLSIESPGFMTGITGIGYELLRLAEPRQVPSVLALEQPGKITPHS